MATEQNPAPSRGNVHMDNSGKGPLQVPGFGDIPLDYELPSEDRFAHAHVEWYQVPSVTIRERAMVAAMNIITDKRNWHVDVFDDSVVEGWRSEAEAAYPRLSGPEWSAAVRNRLLLTQKAWEWCLLELRDKARDSEQKQFVRVLDTGSCVCKSDTLVTISCADTLKTSLSMFYRQPLSDHLLPQEDGSYDIVDPCLYPLVYGKTPVLQDGHASDLNLKMEGYSQTKLAPKHEEIVEADSAMPQYYDESRAREWSVSVATDSERRAYMWSRNFQSLPCDVEFVGPTGTEIQISSYINNLHPKHAKVYSSIEVLLTQSIGLWNDCLVKGIKGLRSDQPNACVNDQWQRGRVPLRIVSYGIQSGPRIPGWALHFDGNPYKTMVERYLKSKDLIDNFPVDADASLKRERVLALRFMKYRWPIEIGQNSPPESVPPPPTPEQWDMAQRFLESPELGGQKLPADWRDNAYQHIESRVKSVERWDYPEPGDAVSYADWHADKNTHRPVVEKASTSRFEGDQYSPSDALYESYIVQLEAKFRDKGLQVIVKIGGNEATPHAPTQEFDETYEQWQVSGRLNDHIVATAIYVYDVANVQACQIEFRQVLHTRFDCYRYSENPPGGRLRSMLWPESDREESVLSMLNIEHKDLCRSCNMAGRPAFQRVGEVCMPEGRLFAFPNIMEYRFAPLQFVDEELPGHCRFVTLYLVDPHYRICSTRNVPPQQHDWWSDEVSDSFVSKGLPREIADHICSAAEDWPMGEAEALLYRQQQVLEQQQRDAARWRFADVFRC